jgi:hypothetical protein
VDRVGGDDDDPGEVARDAIDPDDRHCPSCGVLMLPVGMPSGEIVSRCPQCQQFAI